MFAYGADGRCLMHALQAELDDPRAEPCGRCSVCAGPRFDAPVDAGLARGPTRSCARGRSCCPCAARRRGRPTGRASGSGPSSSSRRAARSREPATAAGTGSSGRAAATGRFDDELVQAWPDLLRPLAPGPRAGVGHRGAVAPHGRARPGLRRAARRRPRPAVRDAPRARRGQPAAARDGQLGAAGRQRPRRIPGPGSTFRPARRCSSTTCACPAGRSPRSARSCG